MRNSEEKEERRCGDGVGRKRSSSIRGSGKITIER